MPKKPTLESLARELQELREHVEKALPVYELSTEEDAALTEAETSLDHHQGISGEVVMRELELLINDSDKRRHKSA